MDEFLKPRCPVKIGDRFYRSGKIPDRIEVIDIQEKRDEGGWFYAITGKLINHPTGTPDKVYSSRLIENPPWIIEKRGVDFY